MIISSPIAFLLSNTFTVHIDYQNKELFTILSKSQSDADWLTICTFLVKFVLVQWETKLFSVHRPATIS